MAAMQIFVSHSHHDSSFCHDLVQALRAAGADIWYDEHNLGSGQLMEIVQRELGHRPVFIVILSPAAFASTWVRRETLWAYELADRDPTRIILPVTAQPLEPDAFFAGQSRWLFLHDFKRIEASDYQPYPYSEAIRRTLRALTLTLPGQISLSVIAPPTVSAETSQGQEGVLSVNGARTPHTPDRSGTSAVHLPILFPHSRQLRSLLVIFLCLVLLTDSGGTWLVVTQQGQQGAHFATATAMLVHAPTAETLLIYKGHTGPVTSVAWSPDDKQIASGGADKTVRIWEVRTGKTLLTYMGHSAEVLSEAWPPKGKEIASGGWDGTVQIWKACADVFVFSSLEKSNLTGTKVSKARPYLETKVEGNRSMDRKRSEGGTLSQDDARARSYRVSPGLGERQVTCCRWPTRGSRCYCLCLEMMVIKLSLLSTFLSGRLEMIE